MKTSKVVLSVLLISAFAVCVAIMAAGAKKHDEPLYKLVRAISKHESYNGKDQLGDEHLSNKAYGHLHIRQPCVDDVNALCKTNYRAQDTVNNYRLSMWIFEKYMKRWATPERLGRRPTFEDMARIWQGGPDGYKDPHTKQYWKKVRAHL